MARHPQPIKAKASVSQQTESRSYFLLPVVLGIYFAVCLLKFSNPPIMEKYVEQPAGLFEAIATNPWPIAWAYWLLALIVLVVIGALIASADLRATISRSLTSGGAIGSNNLHRAVLILPVAWLLWQFISSQFTSSHQLSTPTVVHYAGCVVCFYLGLICLGPQKNLWPFFFPILAAFVIVIAVGLDQHFGGLQEMREHIYKEMQIYPEKAYSPEFLKKVKSTRIFSTLFYPNTLAGALLLFAPIMIMTSADSGARWRLGNASRGVTVAVLIGVAVLCMFLYVLNSKVGLIFTAVLGLSLIFPVPRSIPVALLCVGIAAVLLWSGSKAGWLLALALLVVLFLTVELKRFAISPKVKTILVLGLIVAGLAGFFIRYATFFKTGATSVGARFDYWRAAVHTTAEHPLVGTGPGTFQIAYSRYKPPEAEMARLAHNDYLQQASDSGVPAVLLYTSFIVAALIVTRPRRNGSEASESIGFSPRLLIWLGILGWAAQCCVEFSLQIPALAWPAFALLGGLYGSIAARPQAATI